MDKSFQPTHYNGCNYLSMLGFKLNNVRIRGYWSLKSEEYLISSLQWRHNGRGSATNHQPHDCLLNRLFRRRSKKTSKLRVTSLCAGNSPGTGEFPAQMASNAENVSIWWRHHVYITCHGGTCAKLSDKTYFVQVYFSIVCNLIVSSTLHRCPSDIQYWNTLPMSDDSYAWMSFMTP